MHETAPRRRPSAPLVELAEYERLTGRNFLGEMFSDE
jgi:hypothetical protein